ncbi:radical SAM protein [Halobacteriovorax sp. GB3]|uniref:radical SAM protein n=1 Tax=Halobacteriovorax sp. GB3 TaxID=2719615 RepID=UPI002360D468|nr:radical SAM protein [Halobacteriovorax sp. GB3]MDD0853285.1 radical SAM protein [Halobacteriovorax sp. GB3]
MDEQRLYENLLKYHSAGGRFTYFPRKSQWENKVEISQIEHSIKNIKGSAYLYVHIPFCQSLCTFCGCNIKVTSDRDLVEHYIEAIKAQWQHYLELNPTLELQGVYFGGGSPNFLGVKDLDLLFDTLGVTKKTPIILELDPRRVQETLIDFLKSYNVERVILGLQDIDRKVLKQVNRDQDQEEMSAVIHALKQLKGVDITAELIYGLPHQQKQNLEKAVEFYSQCGITSFQLYPLAPVPWQKASQNAFGVYCPLSTKELYEVYLGAIKALEKLNFEHINFGHWQQSELSKRTSFQNRTIMGNMNYTIDSLIGLGPSAISKLEGLFFQNESIYDKYLFQAKQRKLNFQMTHRQSEQEKEIDQRINEILITKRIPKSLLQKSELTQLMLRDKVIIESQNDYLIDSFGLHFLKYILEELTRSLASK